MVSMKDGSNSITIRGYSVIFCLVTVLSLAGCAAEITKLYPGPEISKDKLSILHNPHSQIQVKGIDSQEVKPGTLMNGTVLPGKHTLEIEYMFYSNNVMVGPISVDMEADLAAGHQYVINAKPFYLKGITEEDCRKLFLGVQVQILDNEKESANFGGTYCSALVPYLFDKENKEIALTTLKKDNLFIVIDKSTLRKGN